MEALFIADLHLQRNHSGTLQLARCFLQTLATRSPRLFILGDLVEYWIGDDADDGSLESVFADLRQLSLAGTEITLMHGNRDFLLGQAFAENIGATLIRDDWLLLEIAPEPALLMHGDTLCTDDQDYQAMRAQLRSAEWQAGFLARPVAQRRAFADDLREQSRRLSGHKAQEIMNVNEDSVRSTLQQHGVCTLLHGHTHKPGTHQIRLPDSTVTRLVVGDWHADHAVYAVLENGQYRLETFTAPAP